MTFAFGSAIRATRRLCRPALALAVIPAFFAAATLAGAASEGCLQAASGDGAGCRFREQPADPATLPDGGAVPGPAGRITRTDYFCEIVEAFRRYDSRDLLPAAPAAGKPFFASAPAAHLPTHEPAFSSQPDARRRYRSRAPPVPAT